MEEIKKGRKIKEMRKEKEIKEEDEWKERAIGRRMKGRKGEKENTKSEK
jgi:hypothetical protein